MGKPSMWDQYRSRYDSSADLVDCVYPELKTDPLVAAALLQIRLAEMALATHMRNLGDIEDA